MNVDFDCIVVGAGPAGSTASYHLAKMGHSVLLLEKQRLPRYKPCGGGVSPEIRHWFDFDFEPVISLKANTFCFSWQMGARVDGLVKDKDIEPLWMVRREKFDYYIVEKSGEQGAEIIDNSGVKNVSFAQGIWSVHTKNRAFTCRYLIAADGSGGPMAKFLGFDRLKYVKFKALEVEVPGENLDSLIYLDFGSINRGYAWNFPKADGFSIGLGGDSKNLKPLLKEYMSNQFQLDINSHRIHGHTINAWNGKQRLHTTQAILAGEAACVVDPFTAEGIRPSIYSGLKAAEAIDQALTGQQSNLAAYSKAIHQAIGKQMYWANIMARFFHIAPKFAYESVVCRPSASTYMGQIMNGQLSYSEAVRKAFMKLAF